MEHDDIPLWRLNLLRAFYLLVAVGLTVSFAPLMLQHSDLWAQRKGETGALMTAVAVLALWGLRYPLQLLPLLIFELVWKTVWLLFIGAQLWLGGAMTPAVEGTAFGCLMGVILTPLVLPWRYIAYHYFKKPAQGWRQGLASKPRRLRYLPTIQSDMMP